MAKEQLDQLKAALADRYAIERELGHGGMATVYLANDLKHHRPVAVKVLRPELAAMLGAERFLNEIAVTANLQHPHILPLFDSGEADGFLYYVMPYVEGESLRDRLEREGRLAVPQALRVMRDLVDALTKAHAQGIVHRDIKPDNVLLSDRHAIVMDFGVAKAVSDATGHHQLTTAGIALGTPAYMAPEQAVADPYIDHRADIYAIGVLAYEMLAGQPPFAARTGQQVLAAHATEPPVDITKHRPDVPNSVAALVMRCLEKDPGDRWQSANDLLAEIDGAGATRSDTAVGVQRLRRWLVATGVLVTIGIGWGLVRRDTSATGTASRNVIAVLPFSVRGGDQFEYLSEGMVSLLSTSLDGTGDLRSVNAHALLGFAGVTGSEGMDTDRARRIAEHFAADLYVLGDIVEVGGRLRLTASVFDRNDDTQALATATEVGNADELFAVVDRLATQLLAALATGEGAPRTGLAVMMTTSLAAVKAYLEGEQLYRAGIYSRAVEAFKTAVAADSTFARAYYRLSMTEERLAWAGDALVSAEAALRHAQRLSARDRQFLAAVVALRRGQASRAQQLFRAIVRDHPDDAEAWYQLGELTFHGNPLRGGSISDAWEPLSRAVFYDPGDFGALYHMVRIAAKDRDRRVLDSLTARFVELNPTGERTPELRALTAFTVGDTADVSAIVEELRRSSDTFLPIAVWSVATFSHNVEGAIALARIMTANDRPRDVRARGHFFLAHLELARGRAIVAEQELALAAQFGDPGAREARGWFAALPFVPMSRAKIESARDQLAEWANAAELSSPRASAFYSAHNGVHQQIRSYLLGVVAVRLGDLVAARGQLRGLDEGAASPAATALAIQLGTGLRAHMALAEGRVEAALQQLQELKIEGWYEFTFVSPFYAGALERYVLAELLFAEGRLEEALGWYVGLGENTAAELVFLGPSLLRRAEIHDRLGQPGQAQNLRVAFDRLWRDADPELRRTVEAF